jgi:hypothetical protein
VSESHDSRKGPEEGVEEGGYATAATGYGRDAAQCKSESGDLGDETKIELARRVFGDVSSGAIHS